MSPSVGVFSSLTIVFNVCLSSNSSQPIWPKGFKFLGFDGGHPGVVIKKFDENQSKNPICRAIPPPPPPPPPKKVLLMVTTLCLSKPSNLLQTITM